MLGPSPERFREEEERLDRLFQEDIMQDIDEFFEKNASPEYLQFLKDEDARIKTLEAQGIIVG